VQEAERYATQVVVVADGELLFTGSPRELEAEVEDADRPAADFEGAFVTFLHQHGH
jgi:ABC-type multidrug transport system ATPase subunit